MMDIGTSLRELSGLPVENSMKIIRLNFLEFVSP